MSHESIFLIHILAYSGFDKVSELEIIIIIIITIDIF